MNQINNELIIVNGIVFENWENKIYQVITVRIQLECLYNCLNIEGLRCDFYIEIEDDCYLGSFNNTNSILSSNVPFSIQSLEPVQLWIRYTVSAG